MATNSSGDGEHAVAPIEHDEKTRFMWFSRFNLPSMWITMTRQEGTSSNLCFWGMRGFAFAAPLLGVISNDIGPNDNYV
ncbi:hypothetical protein NA56DRAFT_705220 [Hyaloscypha hepaticicola]|uniref:Uncharacterized protein n=1 Tax=Hyaloscypha hepaticicola TaxID=2082293 RepID=A0A2J6Q139_9HELO|nr:hypothetical protein NA56DRAFT_705220 [Hyaloscypha hepaticicola]